MAAPLADRPALALPRLAVRTSVMINIGTAVIAFTGGARMARLADHHRPVQLQHQVCAAGCAGVGRVDLRRQGFRAALAAAIARDALSHRMGQRSPGGARVATSLPAFGKPLRQKIAPSVRVRPAFPHSLMHCFGTRSPVACAIARMSGEYRRAFRGSGITVFRPWPDGRHPRWRATAVSV